MTILELDDGLHEGIAESVYHERVRGLASKSVLEMISRAPAVYDAWLKGESKVAKSHALDIGKAMHCALLEPLLYASLYVEKPDFGDGRFKAAKAAKAEWEERNDVRGKVILSSEDARAIDGMVRSVRAHPRAGELFAADGVSELTMKWTDAETGIICKGRADRYVPSMHLGIDLKTCDDARPTSFNRSVENYGYFKQYAFYEEGFRALGEALSVFAFVAVEKEAPYLVTVNMLDDDYLRRGREWVRRNLETFSDCIARDDYSRGYDTKIQILSPHAWAKDAA